LATINQLILFLFKMSQH